MSTAIDPLHDERAQFLDRIRAAAQRPGLSRAEALLASVAAAGGTFGWNEAEAVAEALRHRYDNLVSGSHWLPVALWRDRLRLADLRKNMRNELVLRADGTGSALVDEPVEWLYAAPDIAYLERPSDDERGRTPLTAAQVDALPDDFYVLVKLVGHTQRLDR